MQNSNLLVDVNGNLISSTPVVDNSSESPVTNPMKDKVLGIHDAKRQKPSDYIPGELKMNLENKSLRDAAIELDLYDVLFSEDDSLRNPEVKDDLTHVRTMDKQYKGYQTVLVTTSHPVHGSVYSAYAKKISRDTAPEYIEVEAMRTAREVLQYLYMSVDMIRRRSYVSLPPSISDLGGLT